MAGVCTVLPSRKNALLMHAMPISGQPNQYRRSDNSATLELDATSR
jgi:hypothetical protein